MNGVIIPNGTKCVELYSGTSQTYGDTLKQAYTDFKFLLIAGITNAEYVTMLIPTSMIVSNKDFMLSGMASTASTEQVTFNLQSMTRIRFNSTTTFTVTYQYTNSNWIIKPCAIFGID